jgi:hypothetical protein
MKTNALLSALYGLASVGCAVFNAVILFGRTCFTYDSKQNVSPWKPKPLHVIDPPLPLVRQNIFSLINNILTADSSTSV